MRRRWLGAEVGPDSCGRAWAEGEEASLDGTSRRAPSCILHFSHRCFRPAGSLSPSILHPPPPKHPAVLISRRSFFQTIQGTPGGDPSPFSRATDDKTRTLRYGWPMAPPACLPQRVGSFFFASSAVSQAGIRKEPSCRAIFYFACLCDPSPLPMPSPPMPWPRRLFSTLPPAARPRPETQVYRSESSTQFDPDTRLVVTAVDGTGRDFAGLTDNDNPLPILPSVSVRARIR